MITYPVTLTVVSDSNGQGADGKISAELRYSRYDCAAVGLAIRNIDGQPVGYEPLVWVFARALLSDGLRDAAGIGDVRIWPGTHREVEVIYISLTGQYDDDSNYTLLTVCPAGDVRTFMRRTLACVPLCSENDSLEEEVNDALELIFESTL